MSSAMPIDSSVREVLLKTSAPIGMMERTASLACSPESTTELEIPLRSNAAAAASSCVSDANSANSATASSVGPLFRAAVIAPHRVPQVGGVSMRPPSNPHRLRQNNA